VTYREQEIAALLHGVKSARSLAHQSRKMARSYPKYEREELAECSRHFERARWYLDSMRMMRASQ
jgi:RecA-family ATPase